MILKNLRYDIIKKFFLTIFRNYKKINGITHCHKIIWIACIISSLIDIIDAGSLVWNQNLSKSVKIKAFIRSIFCLSALILANISILILDSKVLNILRVCCCVSIFFYNLFGGDFVIGSVIIATSKI